MSYNLTLQCGCTVYVACHPESRIAHTRIIERRAPACCVRRHEVGLKLYLWELLPQPDYKPAPIFVAQSPGAIRRRRVTHN